MSDIWLLYSALLHVAAVYMSHLHDGIVHTQKMRKGERGLS